MKRPRPRIVKFRPPTVPDDTQFIETLVWVLAQARAGKVKGYAIVYTVENDEGTRTIEAAKAFEELNNMMILGMIRRMEHNYVRRTWPEDGMTDKG